MDDTDQLRIHAERLRASGILGRSRFVEKLFDYLMDCTLQGKTPKEIEVAVDVFGRDGGFDVTQDAFVRVYIHKLRRKLEEYYAGPGTAETQRLIIPKGAYRFTLEQPASLQGTTQSGELQRPRQFAYRRWVIGALAASLLVNLAVSIFLLVGRNSSSDEYRAVREHPIWSRLLADDKPIFVVVGDYYIFGEIDERTMQVQRLLREFSINSRQDLERYLKLNPELESRYLDMELSYLPTASAYAMSEVLPMLAPAASRVRLVTVSELNPTLMKAGHLVYIGYFSGLGMLQDPVFAGSKFAVGETYDELIDRSTERRYVSQYGAHVIAPLGGGSKYHDYGLFSTFAGPTGNQIVVIAGTRDIAVRQLAEMLTTRTRLDELTKQVGDARSFEALYEVSGMDRTNIDGKLLLTSAINVGTTWSEGVEAKRAKAQDR